MNFEFFIKYSLQIIYSTKKFFFLSHEKQKFFLANLHKIEFYIKNCIRLKPHHTVLYTLFP